MDKWKFSFIISIVTSVIIISGLFFVGWQTENELNSKINVLNEVQLELEQQKEEYSDLQRQIIVFQENDKYSTAELKKAREERNDLQELYDSLWFDATSCYWANVCSYSKEVCEEHFTWGDDSGYNYQDYYFYYSDSCDQMYKDWDDYLAVTSGD